VAAPHKTAQVTLKSGPAGQTRDRPGLNGDRAL
jgi:hypothetical protein